MLMYLSFVPPGTTEAEFTLPFDLPAIPREGDTIAIDRAGEGIGFETFHVRRICWLLVSASDEDLAKGEDGRLRKLYVECEFVRSFQFNSEAHIKACEDLEKRGFVIQRA
jgi:hypothetical protein